MQTPTDYLLHLADNALVRRGDVLFVVDPEPYRIALEQAEAALSAAERALRRASGLFSSSPVSNVSPKARAAAS